jgi:hypothetical protein
MTPKQLTPATKRRMADPRVVLSPCASAKIVASRITDATIGGMIVTVAQQEMS